MNIVFVRHGATMWNLTGKWQGSMDIELSDLGREQAVNAAKNLKLEDFSIIYSSPKSRALETANIIASETSKKIIVDSRIAERNLGLFEGMTTVEISGIMGREMNFVDIVSCTDPVDGMESLEEQFRRGREFLNEIKAKKMDAVVVSHGVMIGIMLELITGNDFRHSRIENCQIIRGKIL